MKGNLYCYCGNSPVYLADIDGQSPIEPGPTVPNRSEVYASLGIILGSPETPFERINNIYSTKFGGKHMLYFGINNFKKGSKESFKQKTKTYNWAERAAYDIGLAISDLSEEIGDLIDYICLYHGVPYSPGEYVDYGIQIASSIFMSDSIPETHQYTIYSYNSVYKHVNGFRYTSFEQQFTSCEWIDCPLHNSGIVNLIITVSNDIIPFYVGTRKSYVFSYVGQ